MDPISVPAPSPQAFNKQRPISDLVKKQIEHFKHVEARLPAEVRAQLPQHEIVTEQDAARYIGPITAYLRSRPDAIPAPVVTRAIRRPAVTRPGRPLALAASAAKSSSKKKSKKPSVARKGKPLTKSAPKKKPAVARGGKPLKKSPKKKPFATKKRSSKPKKTSSKRTK